MGASANGQINTIAGFIEQQPDAIGEIIETVAPQVRQIGSLPPDGEIHLVGSGTSFNALLATEQALSRATGLQTRTLPPMAFLSQDGPALAKLQAVVVLSHSGESATSVAAAERAVAMRLPTMVVTGYADSPMAKVAAQRIIIPVSDEKVGAKTKGYTASLLALLMLARWFETGESTAIPGLDRFCGAYRPLVAAAQSWAADYAAGLADADAIAVLGQGRHLASATEGALKVAEIAGIPTLPAETEDACHGRFFGYTKNTRALFIAGSAQEKQLAVTASEGLAHFGMAPSIVDLSGGATSAHDIRLPWPDAGETPELDLLAAAVPFQWLAEKLARVRNRVPEIMPYPGLGQRLGLRAKASVPQ